MMVVVLQGLFCARLMDGLWARRAWMVDPVAIHAASIIQAAFRTYRHNKRCKAMNTLRGWCKQLVTVVKTQVMQRRRVNSADLIANFVRDFGLVTHHLNTTWPRDARRFRQTVSFDWIGGWVE